VDDHVRAVFANLDRVTRDDHFHYIVRFVDTRLSQGIASLNLYQRILRGARERDQASLAHAELKLSGLVKRDPDGFLVVRNRIYQRLFDERWVQSTQPKRTAVRYRQLGIAASVALFITVGAMTAWQVLFVQPSISELNVREMLAEMNISIGTAEGGVIHAVFPPRATQADVEDAIPLLQALGSVTELDLTRTQIKDVKPLARLSTLKVLKLSGTPTKDVTPLEALTGLEALDLSGTQVSSLMPLAKLPALVSLSLGSQDVPLRDTYNLILGPQASSSWAERLEDYGTKPVRFQAAPVSDISPLADMPSLQELDLSHTDIADLSPLAGLAALRILDLDHTPVKDVNPLADLPELKMLELDNTAVEDVTPLSGLTALEWLDISRTEVSNLAPLSDLDALRVLEIEGAPVENLVPLEDLTALEWLALNETWVSNLTPLARLAALRVLELSRTKVANVAPLRDLIALEQLDLSGTQVSDVAPLAGLSGLRKLDLKNTPVANVAPLRDLTALQLLDLRGTNVSVEDIERLREVLLSQKNQSLRVLRPVRMPPEQRDERDRR
jgi:Leucine-rich repeat (LRR) protein